MSKFVKASVGQAQPERVICILGMHRSGTSCLTGSLQEAGVDLGECHTWNPYNLKGNRENQKIIDINDSVLQHNGGSWDRPPRHVSWGEEHVLAARTVLEGHAGVKCFGFKDPRTLLTLSGWVQLFPAMEFVGIFRHPNSVAQSLEKRSEMPREEGLKLWYQYNKRLYRQLQKNHFPILCFDEESSVFQRKLNRVIDDVQCGAGQWRGEFYDEALRSPLEAIALPLPWKIRRLYRKLQNLAQ